MRIILLLALITLQFSLGGLQAQVTSRENQRDSILSRRVDTLRLRVDSIQSFIQTKFLPPKLNQKLNDTLLFVRDSLYKLERNKEMYDCNNKRMALNNSLNDYIFKVFDKVVVGNDEVVKNGSAVNLSVTDKTKLSANHILKLKKWLAISLGLNANVTNNETVLVNNKGIVQSGWGATAKLSFLPGANFASFRTDSCEVFRFSRMQHINDELIKYRNLMNVNTDSLSREIGAVQRKLENDSNEVASFNLSRDVLKEDYKKNRQLLDTLNKQLTIIKKIRSYTKSQFLDSVFIKSIEEFEKLAPWNGYKVKWFDLEFSANTNNKTLLYTSTIVNTDKINENKLFWKYKFGPSFNYASTGPKHAFYANALLAVQNAYKLEGKNPIDTFNYANVKIVNLEKNSAVYDVSQISNYDRQHWIFSPSILINCFYGKYKILGVEVFGEMLLRDQLEGIEEKRKKALNLRFGLIANFSEKFKTTLPTIGLFLKADEYIYSSSLNDYLSIGLRVGVPFDRIFNKKS